MTEEISFIHAADLHLDSPFLGLTHLPEAIFDQIRHSTFQAFDRLIDTAITKQVDFILLVGDLVDHERQSLKAQIHLRTAFEKLQAHHIAVYLSYGNHDFIHGNHHAVTFPDNVFIFPNEQVNSFIHEKNGKPIAKITGFSYENRAVKQEKITEYPAKDMAIPFQIGTLHGMLYGNKHHDPYAPFQLQQLQEKNYDYWALGHIHQRAELADDAPIIYSGNIQGRHRKETGEKGCYFIQMTKATTSITFTPLQSIQFINETVHISHCETIDAIEKTLLNQLPKDSNRKYLIHVTWECTQEKWLSMHLETALQELIEVINDNHYGDEAWNFIYKTKVKIEKKHLAEHDAFFTVEMKKAFRNIVPEQELKGLYQHSKARQFLEIPSAEELLTEAEQLLLMDLLRIEKAES